MGLFDRIKQWATTSDEERVELDRRAFLKGMTVTGAGLLVPGAAFFDMGRGMLLDRGRICIQNDYSGFEMRVPVRTEMVVLGPDDPGNRVIGFSIFEGVGIGVYNPTGLTRLKVKR